MKKIPKSLLTTVFLLVIHFIAFLLFGGIYEEITNFKKSSLSLTYRHNEIAKPEALNFSPLNPESEFTTALDSPVDFLGSVSLYFKPLQNLNETGLDGHFNFLISIYNQTNNEFILNSEYEVLHNKQIVLEYPFGFTAQENSKGIKYKITIKPLEKNGIDPSFMGLATQNSAPIITYGFHLPANKVRENLYKATYLFMFKLIEYFSQFTILSTLSLFNMLMTYRIAKKNKHRDIKHTFIINLAILGLNGILKTNRPNFILTPPLSVANDYCLFSCLFFGLLLIIYNETKYLKTLKAL